MKNKEMTATVYNDGIGQATQMLDLGFTLATNESLEEIELQDDKYIRLPYTAVTEDIVDQYLTQEEQND